MTTTISSALGNGMAMAQAGSYDAVDARRLLDGVASEGILSAGSYAVTQRGRRGEHERGHRGEHRRRCACAR